MGLLGATSVGVGAIVGGGVLALAGLAFATTGPAAIVAFGLNGVIALLTALSFAEMASRFPQSGGTYTYAKKVLSVETAFSVGWVVWFASIVAAVLYAAGFAHFGVALVNELWESVYGPAPAWLTSPYMLRGVAIATIAVLATNLMRKVAHGGQWVNIGKVGVFSVLIVGGLWAVLRQPTSDTEAALHPFFTAGFSGLVQAMGYTFIAMQGFDLIAAVGGEVREPSKTLPRAMVLSLGIALVIYLPLLFVITTVGSPPGQPIQAVAAADPEGIVAIAAQNYLGRFGYWLVMVAAILSMLSALQANLFAASRIARAMARDRTLPSTLGVLHSRRRTPTIAVGVTATLVSVTLLVLRDLDAAGAAASLIFLITFALAHGVAILVRRRSPRNPPPFAVPLFPLVPVVGGTACVALAVFQGLAVPRAGVMALVWLGIGGALFLGLFARRARLMDASRTAYEPNLAALRGRTPLVLVPVANPQNVEAMTTLAEALVPDDVGRVLMQTVVVAPEGWQPEDDPEPLEKSQAVLREVLRASTRRGIGVEILTTVASQPMAEIARVARLHRCESVLVGLSAILEGNQETLVESLLGTLDADVVVLRSSENWRLSEAKKILIPVAGRGGHEPLLALLLGSLLRNAEREVTFLRVLATSAKSDEMRRAERDLRRLAEDLPDERFRTACRVEVLRSDDPLASVVEHAERSDLLILGVQRFDRRKKLFGDFTRQLAQRLSCPIIAISRRG